MPRRSTNTMFWLIANHDNGHMGVLTIEPYADSGKETLPIFSSEEEAEMFLKFEVLGNEGWRVRESTVGELVLMLLRSLASVRKVALDPLPIEVGGEAMVRLVSLGRARFLLSLMDEHELGPSLWLSSRKCGVG
jgi:hypothetical protein